MSQNANTPQDLLQTLTRSVYRKDLLFYLGDNPKTQSEINTDFKVTSPEIQPRLKEMEAANLIIKQEGAYQLTLLGRILSSYYKPLMDTITAIESNGDFWKTHDLSAVPEELLYRVKELKDCNVVKNENCNLFESHIEFRDHISNCCTHVHGATCVINPMWRSLFLDLSSRGIPIELILSRGVYEKLISEYSSEFESLLQNGVLVYVYEDNLKTAFATTGDFFSLGLMFKTVTSYDNTLDLQGTDPAAIRWGEDLFKYYKEKSIKVPNSSGG